MAAKLPKRPSAPWVPKRIHPKRQPEWHAWVTRWNAAPEEVPVCFLDGSPLPNAWREQLLSGQLNPLVLQWRVAHERHFDTWDDFEVVEEGPRAGWVWAPEPDGGRALLPPPEDIPPHVKSEYEVCVASYWRLRDEARDNGKGVRHYSDAAVARAIPIAVQTMKSRVKKFGKYELDWKPTDRTV